MTKLNVEEWDLKFPIPIYGLTDDQRALLPMGQTLRVVLQSDRVKDGKDGTKLYDHFWSFIELEPEIGPYDILSLDEPHPDDDLFGGGTAAHTRPQGDGEGRSHAAPAQGPATARTGPQDKDDAIRRAVALKAAVEFTGRDDTTEGVLAAARQFLPFLEGREEA